MAADRPRRRVLIVTYSEKGSDGGAGAGNPSQGSVSYSEPVMITVEPGSKEAACYCSGYATGYAAGYASAVGTQKHRELSVEEREQEPVAVARGMKIVLAEDDSDQEAQGAGGQVEEHTTTNAVSFEAEGPACGVTACEEELDEEPIRSFRYVRGYGAGQRSGTHA